MPAPETDYRFQKAQLWERLGDDPYGNPLIGPREEITVRWEDKQLEMINPLGQPIKVDALVIHICNIVVGSIMWKGCEDDLPADGIPTTNIMEVVAFDDIPDVKARAFRKTVGLKRYNDRLPTVVS